MSNNNDINWTRREEELAKELWFNGFYAKDFQDEFPTFADFMASDTFTEECNRLRSKFD